MSHTPKCIPPLKNTLTNNKLNNALAREEGGGDVRITLARTQKRILQKGFANVPLSPKGLGVNDVDERSVLP
jgi:hypothetical protein